MTSFASSRPLPRLVIGALAALIVALGLAVELGALGRGSIDGTAVADVHRYVLHHRGIAMASRVSTDFGAPLTVDVLTVISAALLWLRGRAGDALFVASVRVATLVVDTLLKESVRRPRPTLANPLAHAHGFSFPSGHASGAASVYLPIAVVLMTFLPGPRRRVVIGAATLLCIAVATSRVLLGVHYPTDVIAGLSLGALLMLLLVPVRGWRAGRGQPTGARR